MGGFGRVLPVLRYLSFHPDAISYVVKSNILRMTRRPLVPRYPAARCTVLCKPFLPFVFFRPDTLFYTVNPEMPMSCIPNPSSRLFLLK